MMKCQVPEEKDLIAALEMEFDYQIDAAGASKLKNDQRALAQVYFALSGGIGRARAILTLTEGIPDLETS